MTIRNIWSTEDKNERFMICYDKVSFCFFSYNLIQTIYFNCIVAKKIFLRTMNFIFYLNLKANLRLSKLESISMYRI